MTEVWVFDAEAAPLGDGTVTLVEGTSFCLCDNSGKEDWVLFLGRCVQEKGMHLAIDAARAAGRRIVLAAKCFEPLEKA